MNTAFASIHAELTDLCAALAELSLIRTPADLNEENVRTVRAIAAAAAAAVAAQGDVSDLL